VCGAGLLCRNFWLFKKKGDFWLCIDAGNVRCVAVCGCSPLSSWMALALWGLLHLLLRVACVVGVAMRGQVVCCCTFVRSGIGAVSGVGRSGGMCSGISD
jgi:hypothetical protein